MKKYIVLGMVSMVMVGCATVGSVPQSASLVNFDGVEGKTGWSEYKHVENFANYTPDQVYDAAKVGLGDAGFSLRRADKANGVVIGEHGITLHDWNVIAAVYFRPYANGTQVAVVVEGSKDIGFSGDVTSDGWTGKILKGMRQYLNETHTSVLRVDKEDIK